MQVEYFGLGDWKLGFGSDQIEMESEFWDEIE